MADNINLVKAQFLNLTIYPNTTTPFTFTYSSAGEAIDLSSIKVELVIKENKADNKALFIYHKGNGLAISGTSNNIISVLDINSSRLLSGNKYYAELLVYNEENKPDVEYAGYIYKL